MDYQISRISHNWEVEQGDLLLDFLSNFEDEKRPKSFWTNRLQHWWNKNPYRKNEDPLGWILKFKGKIVGFLGVISFEYYLNNVIHKALATTTWRVCKDHRNEAMKLYFNLIELQKKYIVINTTPSAKVKEILSKLKYNNNNICNNYIFPITKKGRIFPTFPWNIFVKLCSGMLPDKNLKLVGLEDDFSFNFSKNGNELSRNTSKEYLSWYCDSPAMSKKFVGLVNEKNELQCYVVAIKKNFNGVLAWRVIDYQSVNHSIGLVYVLIKKIMHSSHILGDENINFLILSIFESKKEVKKPLLIPNKKIETTHYFTQPDLLKEANKRCIKAEGDYGL